MWAWLPRLSGAWGLVGHSGTSVTELVYRHQLRPVIQTGAVVMDTLFGMAGDGSDADRQSLT